MNRPPDPAGGLDDEEGARPVRIVGVGASAGGLESLERFFASVPADSGMAIVVVQHLSPDFRSMMSELLGRRSAVPVQVVEDGMLVRADHAYLLPPGKEMRLAGGRLELTDKEPSRALALPIDVFFRSLAADAGSKAAAVVLSGTGSDGSRGIRDIKRCGGVVLAESAESAKFDGMPLSALATGLVDYSGDAADLARFLTGSLAADDSDAEIDPNDPPMTSILRILHRGYGLDFALYKRSTVARRIQRRVDMLDSVDLEDYAQRIQADADELSALYHDLLIGVTRFFRDAEAFEFLAKRIIPDIVDRVPESDEVRAWVAGCATGEEAYSLAILFHEEMTRRGRDPNFKVLATDVHRASLERGSAGVFPAAQLEGVSPERRERYFTERAKGYQVTSQLRERIVFAPHNVTQDAPFTNLHLVSCRNLLIYLEPETQKTVLSLFHFGLSTGGVLFLGESESTGPFTQEFDAIDEHWKVYRKRRDVRLLDPLRLPVARKASSGPGQRPLPAAPMSGGEAQLLSIYDQLLDTYMPPGLLVDEHRELVDSFGGAEKYLHLGGRRPSTNVLELLRGELRTVVGAAIQRVLGDQPYVRYQDVPLSSDDGRRRATVTARAYGSNRTPLRHVLLTIEEERDASTSEEPVELELTAESAVDRGAKDERVRVLESELAYTRESLQGAVEAQQTSNEELQASNEELVASNEELQSTNEELHSVNEELYTVNSEYQKKIEELRELNTDMQHLIDRTDIGTLFLDSELAIRKFTPRIASVFHIRLEDVGRDIRGFSHNLRRSELFEELESVMNDGDLVEDEVQDRDGTTFFLRVLPYRAASSSSERAVAASTDSALDPALDPSAAESIEGVMLSLTDISALDEARAKVRRLSAIVETSEDAILSKDLEGVIKTWNRGAERLYGYTAEEVVGKNVRMLAPPEYQQQIGEFLEGVRRGEGVEHVETVRWRKDGSAIDVSVSVSPLHDRDGAVIGASAIARDISALKRAQRVIEQRESRIRLLLDSTAEAIVGLRLDGTCVFSNPACARMLGYDSAEELIGESLHDVVHHTHVDGSPYAPSECPIQSVLRTGRGTHSDTEIFYRKDGSTFPVEYWSTPVWDGDRIEGGVVTFMDITARKRADEEIRLAAKRQEHFLAMLSHELRNPLAAVLSATNLMQVSAEDADAMRRSRSVIDRQARHMARLLDDLLDVSRITRGGIELRKQDLDLRVPIRLAVETMLTQLESRDMELRLELPDDPVPVRGDRARLQQVFGNLLANAIKYSPAGRPIDVVAVREGELVTVRVEDQGYGIAADLLPQIFKLFVQTQQGLARSKGGLGVGLALVKQLVDLHGGTVAAHSDGPGEGSRFEVSLPLQPNAKLPVAGDDDDDGRGALPPRVVLVEDQDDSREMLRQLLEAKGYDVVAVRDGLEAVETIARVHPDVAIVDIGLPKLDGFGVARRIRENGVLDDVRLVALTGYGTEEDIAAAREAGFSEHLTKPANPERLEEILTRRK